MKSGERVVVADNESEAAASSEQASLDFLKSGGEMGGLIRALDWSKTPLGPRESWPLTLRMMVGFLLANRFPLMLWWGPEYVCIYNDAYRPILGRKHPWALGLPVRECWQEIWHVLQPLIDAPFNGGPATWMEDFQVEINRYGFTEETHFTIAYSPVPDETAPRGIGGVLATVHEITEKVIAERRAAALRDLGTHVAESETAEDACAVAAAMLANYAKDVPFALLYLIDPDSKHARLAGAAGVGRSEAISPLLVELDGPAGASGGWPLAEAIGHDEMVIVEDLRNRFDAVPAGPWSDAPSSAVVMPLRSNKAHQLAGFLIAGISPRLALDNLYRAFLELVATQVATSIAKARAYEEERKRAEALAEIDRAKTAFFSNVSHEFRTPLTLMLGPLEEELAADTLGPLSRERLALVHRSGLRLQKMVNSLLDFSRIEAGRVQAVYEPTDLASLTIDVASNFRSAMEKAGLAFHVNCPPLSEPVYVDREMWEKIVLNLLSNAFKFTFEGSVTVALRPSDEGVELSVEDTGIGIPAHEMPHLFERFHRVKDAHGRTFEGTGIGLALVNELVRLHGGSVRVESDLEKGSAFRVYIPLGASHLPQERISGERRLASTALRSEVYVAEALRWLPDHSSVDDSTSGEAVMEEVPLAAPSGSGCAGPRRRVLLADDNADMRQYIQRLLNRDYDVTAAANGEEALRAAREQLPDLVLSDAMMPGLDGFGLLRELRADPITAMVPVILLSARAGEEARIEGLDAGADDYLIKPFSARELAARIRAVLTLAHVRREAQAELLKRETELRRANEELEQFAYSASHDLKEPLRMVMAYSQLLSRRSSGKLDAQENEFLGRVLQGAQRMEALLGDLLRYARVASEPELSKKAAELNAVFERALGNLQAAIEESRAQITCGPLPALFVEPIRLQQVFQNLIGNAIKYRRPEGQACIRVSALKDGAEWIFSVQDDGVGIEPQYQQQIFGLFKRLHNDGSSGSGLGLAICQRTVEHYGGRIWVESNPGHGSTFFFALPAALEHATENIRSTH